MAGNAGQGGAAGRQAGMGGGQAGAAGGGNGMTGGQGGTAGMLVGTYDPCPPKGTACRIVPFGDSITDGYSASDEGGYRSRLFHLAQADKKTVTFAGSVSGGPATVDGVEFPSSHEGHSGASISDLYPAAESLADGKPHIVLVMAGANGGDPDDTTAMGMLLDKLAATVPNALIVVTQMLPFRDNIDAERIALFNGNIPKLVKQRADAGKHVVAVDAYHAFLANPTFSKDYLVDYAHPTDAGYEVVASVFYKAIAPVLR